MEPGDMSGAAAAPCDRSGRGRFVRLVLQVIQSSPDNLTCSHQCVQHGGLVAGHSRRQQIALQDREGQRRSCSCSTASRRASCPRRSEPMPCHETRKRPSASGDTGSTSRLRRARDRLRSRRNTSASTHSRSTPPGRNSPCMSRPLSVRRARVIRQSRCRGRSVSPACLA